jgi:hypothetical protein
VYVLAIVVRFYMTLPMELTELRASTKPINMTRLRRWPISMRGLGAETDFACSTKFTNHKAIRVNS